MKGRCVIGEDAILLEVSRLEAEALADGLSELHSTPNAWMAFDEMIIEMSQEIRKLSESPIKR